MRARRAVQLSVNQGDYMQAIVGDDVRLWSSLPSFFTPGTAEYTDFGGKVMTGPRRLDEARLLLAQSDYAGEPIVLMAAADVPITKVQADVTNANLTAIGMTVDYLTTDLNARRTRKDRPDHGGWHIFHTWHEGADCINPLPYAALRTSGDTAWFGWPKDDAIEALIGQWNDFLQLCSGGRPHARDQRRINGVRHLCANWLLSRSDQAWRRELTGMVAAPFPVFWGVSKG